MMDIPAIVRNVSKCPTCMLAKAFGIKPRGAEGWIDKKVYWRFFPFKRDGVMVEVGAAGPDFLSVGKYYRSKGWKVLSVEPNPTFAEMHRKAGNIIHQVACSDHDSDGVPFQIVEDTNDPYITEEALSSLEIRRTYIERNPDYCSRMITRNIQVNVRRLDTILAEEGNQHIDLLLVDTEGWEIQVMEGLSINPRIVVLEDMDMYHDSSTSDSYQSYMEQRGYKLVFSSMWNYVYEDKTTCS